MNRTMRKKLRERHVNLKERGRRYHQEQTSRITKGCGEVQELFLPKSVTVVKYDLVHKPVTVLSENIEMDWMWNHAPGLADFVEDLPVGMGNSGLTSLQLLYNFMNVDSWDRSHSVGMGIL